MLPKVVRIILVASFTGSLIGIAVPASAQITQSVQVGAGVFMPTGYDNRVAGDVLVEDLNSLRFGKLTSAQVSGEWALGLGSHIEFAAGVGYQSRTVPSTYRDFFVNQDIRLKIVPTTVLVRFLPFGRPGRTQPYIGVGAAELRWRYSEFGDFIDADANTFNAAFVGTGWSPAVVVVGGIRVPVEGDILSLSLEGRYQSATGNLPSGFLSNKIDLSGSSVNVWLQIRY